MEIVELSGDEKRPLLSLEKSCIAPEDSTLFQKDQPSKLDANIQQKVGSGDETRRRHSLSNVEAFIHLVKGSLGTGILCMPMAIKLSGLLLGPIGVLIMGSAAVAAMYALALSSRILCCRTGKVALDYGNVAYEVALPYSEIAANRFRWTVNAFLIIAQFGFCCIYVLFMQEHFITILQACGVSFDGIGRTNLRNIMTGVVTILFILSAFARNLTNFSFLSLSANIAMFVSLCIMWSFTFSHLNITKPGYGGPIKDLPLAAPAGDWPLFFGSMSATFELIGIVLPTENIMKQPNAFPRVFLMAMVVVFSGLVVTGVTGYMAFGENTQAVLSLNLPSSGNGSWIYTVAQLLYVFVIHVSFMTQFYILMTIVEPHVMNWSRKLHLKQPIISSYVFRVGMVMLFAFAVLLVPQISLFYPLAGSLSSGALAFVFPPIIFLLTFQSELGKKRRVMSLLIIFLFVGIAVMGVVGSVFGTYSSIKQIAEYYTSGHRDHSQTTPISNNTSFSNNASLLNY